MMTADAGSIHIIRTYDAAFEGCGVRAISYAGAVAALADAGWVPARLAGTSGGAIAAALLAAGHTAAGLVGALAELDYAALLDGPRTAIGRWWAAHTRLGIHPGDRLHGWIADRLAERGVETFADVVGPLRPPLKVVAVRVSRRGRRRGVVVFPDDLADYGLGPGDLSVADAVRMSISIPYFFEPSWWEVGDHQLCMTDGGVLMNFPFGILGDDPRPTVGFRFLRPDGGPPGSPADPDDSDIRGLVGYTHALAETILWGHDDRAIAHRSDLATVSIDPLGISPTNFAGVKDRVADLIEAGRIAGERTAAALDAWAAGEVP